MCLRNIYTDINPNGHKRGLEMAVAKCVYYELVTAHFNSV